MRDVIDSLKSTLQSLEAAAQLPRPTMTMAEAFRRLRLVVKSDTHISIKCDIDSHGCDKSFEAEWIVYIGGERYATGKMFKARTLDLAVQLATEAQMPKVDPVAEFDAAFPAEAKAPEGAAA